MFVSDFHYFYGWFLRNPKVILKISKNCFSSLSLRWLLSLKIAIRLRISTPLLRQIKGPIDNIFVDIMSSDILSRNGKSVTT
jgi:hypothetical protein